MVLLGLATEEEGVVVLLGLATEDSTEDCSFAFDLNTSWPPLYHEPPHVACVHARQSYVHCPRAICEPFSCDVDVV